MKTIPNIRYLNHDTAVLGNTKDNQKTNLTAQTTENITPASSIDITSNQNYGINIIQTYRQHICNSTPAILGYRIYRLP